MIFSFILWFLSPSELIQTRFIFEHVLSRVSNVMSIMNCAFQNTCCCMGAHISPKHDIKFSGVFRIIIVYVLYTYIY